MLDQSYRVLAKKLKAYLNQKNLYRGKRRIAKQLYLFEKPYKLHLGCGRIEFEGWINIDSNDSLKTVDVVWDLTQGIPFEDSSCQFIYSEHFLEHMPVGQGVLFLRECYRVLQTGGVIRIAMPSLDVLLEKIYQNNWQDQDWLTWPEYQFIQTRAEMLNIIFRWWGHQWIYDREELYRRLRESGFKDIRECEWGNSNIEELKNRETRKDSLLIFEVQK